MLRPCGLACVRCRRTAAQPADGAGAQRACAVTGRCVVWASGAAKVSRWLGAGSGGARLRLVAGRLQVRPSLTESRDLNCSCKRVSMSVS